MSAPSEKCPLCGKARADAYKPFCSKRCADLDLGQWLKGGYAIPGKVEDDEQDSVVQPPSNDDDAV